MQRHKKICYNLFGKEDFGRRTTPISLDVGALQWAQNYKSVAEARGTE